MVSMLIIDILQCGNCTDRTMALLRRTQFQIVGAHEIADHHMLLTA